MDPKVTKNLLRSNTCGNCSEKRGHPNWRYNSVLDITKWCIIRQHRPEDLTCELWSPIKTSFDVDHNLDADLSNLKVVVLLSKDGGAGVNANAWEPPVRDIEVSQLDRNTLHIQCQIEPFYQVVVKKGHYMFATGWFERGPI